jgi:Signal transduction histidine kinase
LAAAWPLKAQNNNPYQIEDECYEALRLAEEVVDDVTSEDFDNYNQRLLDLSIVHRDDKARALYYVLALRRLCRLGEAASIDQREFYNKSVNSAFENLRTVARETGLTQYYYYSYDLAQTYYFNTRQVLIAFDLLDKMLKDAEKENEEYGQWQALRFLAQSYQQQDDPGHTRYYLQQCLRLYDESRDPIVREQPVARIYCDLADTYDFATDSSRLYYDRAYQFAVTHLDTLRCVYYQTLLAAYDRDIRKYEAGRDQCLSDPAFLSFFRTGDILFLCSDEILRGEKPIMPTLDKLALPKQKQFIGRLASENGMYDISYYMLRMRFVEMQNILSRVNALHLEEASGLYENFSLSKQLRERDQEVALAMHLLILLTLFILIAGLVLSRIHVLNLRKARDLDEERIRELREANEQVQLANAAKTRFVQNMSHEVRTPLNAVVGFSQLLALPDGSFPAEEKEEFAGHIINNTNMLTMLLDDILNASAMDTGNYRINYGQGEVHFIAKAAIRSAEHRLQPGVTMSYEPESEEPFQFETDPHRVQQILINLLTNACKHTEKGRIVLSSSLTRRPGYVSYAVTDTGHGVPPEMAEKIFDRFHQAGRLRAGYGPGAEHQPRHRRTHGGEDLPGHGLCGRRRPLLLRSAGASGENRPGPQRNGTIPSINQ